MVKAEATIFPGRVRRQQSRRPTQADKFPSQILGGPVRRLAWVVLKRNDLFLDEAVNPITQIDQVTGEFEIDHGFLVLARRIVSSTL